MNCFMPHTDRGVMEMYLGTVKVSWKCQSKHFSFGNCCLYIFSEHMSKPCWLWFLY